MHKIEISKSAAKELEKIHKIDAKLYSRLINAIESLREDHYIGKKLKGELADYYSIRVGSYRIIYTIKKNMLIVFVVDVGHRRDVYLK